MGDNVHDKIEDLRKRRAQVMEGGGAARIQKIHESGRLTAREREILERILAHDPEREDALAIMARLTDEASTPLAREAAEGRSSPGHCIWHRATGGTCGDPDPDASGTTAATRRHGRAGMCRRSVVFSGVHDQGRPRSTRF